jgi:TPR repeat protein
VKTTESVLAVVAMVSALVRDTKTAISVCHVCCLDKIKPMKCRGCHVKQYCSTACQLVDWQGGHKNECKQLRREAEVAPAEAPTPLPSPPEVVSYGPAPRSRADEERARIAAEHEAARARREANPEPEPSVVQSARFAPHCPVCQESWDVNQTPNFLSCCCQLVCMSCARRRSESCPLCRAPALTPQEGLARLRRHEANNVPEASVALGNAFRDGTHGLRRNPKTALKQYKRGAELGSVEAMCLLGFQYKLGALGVKLDRRKAKSWYQRAADRGHAASQFNLSNSLRDEGAIEEAFRYCRLAAEQGFTDAELHLGDHYIYGHGVGRDPVEARRWWTRAAAKGDERAQDLLAQTG